jgi:hypothetical protein
VAAYPTCAECRQQHMPGRACRREDLEALAGHRESRNPVTPAPAPALNDTQKRGKGRPKGSGQGLTRAQRTAKWRKDNPQAHRDQQARSYARKAK